MRLKVLHDWDEPYKSERRSLYRAAQLILYALSRKVSILRRLPIVRPVYDELYRNSLALAKLDRLLGVHGIFGIRDDVAERYPDILNEIRRYAEVRRHVHFDLPDRRMRKWEPPLNQSPATWHYDRKYVKGQRNVEGLLDRDELPIFHVDYPEFLSAYIDWLHWVLIENGQIYRRNEGI